MPEKLRRIRLLHTVRSGIPLFAYAGAVARPGIYDAHLNPRGAVSVVAADGELLGVKPDEFEWVEEAKP